MDGRYGSGLKGLNTSGGTNRFKFQGKHARAKRVDVDVAHKVRAEGFLDADKAQQPESEGGSFFQQELDRSKELNVTPPFKRFYYKVSDSLLLAKQRAKSIQPAPTRGPVLASACCRRPVSKQASLIRSCGGPGWPRKTALVFCGSHGQCCPWGTCTHARKRLGRETLTEISETGLLRERLAVMHICTTVCSTPP